MADFVFNIAKGRVAELYNRVKSNDPGTAVLGVVVLATTGLEADSVLMDANTLADVVAGTTNEVTNTGYARKSLADTALIAFAPDDTNNRVDLDIPDQTWTAVAAGDGWSKLIVCYVGDGTNTVANNANIIPLTAHDFAVTPDGSDITAVINSAGFYRAQ